MGGIDAADRLSDILKESGYADIKRILPTNKDWNEDLKQLNGVEFLSAVPHKRKEMYYETVSDLQHFKCNPDRLIDRLSKTFRNGQYMYLAEYSLAASAFFIGRSSENTMFEKLKDILVEEMSINPSDITLDAELVGDLDFNSLELADLVVLCEERFNIEFDDTAHPNLVTIRDVVDYLEAHAEDDE